MAKLWILYFTLECVVAKTKPLIILRLCGANVCKPELLWMRPVIGCFSVPLSPQNSEGKGAQDLIFFSLTLGWNHN